jgi:hypothetical protein
MHGGPPREHVESFPDGDKETSPVDVTTEQAELDATSWAWGDRLPAASYAATPIVYTVSHVRLASA